MRHLSPAAAAWVLVSGCQEPPRAEVPALGVTTAATRDAPAAVDASTTAARTAAFTPAKVETKGQAMGTHLAFAAYTTPRLGDADIRAAFDAAIAEIRRIEALMTTWRPDSEVSQINVAAGRSAVHVGDETFDVIKESLHASAISEGTFDITFQTLHGLWKFDEDLDPHPPSERDLKARLAFVGWRNVKLDDAKKTVMLTKHETQIGLGGIAKGYAVDKAAAVLQRAGVESFYVQAGGDLLAHGKKPDGTAWHAGVRDPRGTESQYFAKLDLTDHAFSTAGDYERSYIVDGKRYHHIIDPRTGHPATACRSVTIWAPTAFLADEIDDAVFILGPEKGLALVASLDGVGAVIVDAKNNLWVSPRLRGKIELVGAPTDGI